MEYRAIEKRGVPLFWQIFLPIALLILGTGTLLGWLLFDADLRTHNVQVQTGLAQTARVLRPVIVESAITGDYARISEYLDDFTAHHPDLAAAEWHWGEVALRSERRHSGSPAHSRAGHFTDPELCVLEEPIVFAGEHYGRLRLQCDPAAAETHIWRKQMTQMGAIGAVMVLSFVLLGATLRGSLNGLRSLIGTVKDLHDDRTARMQVTGAREIRELALTLNATASQVQERFDSLDRARAALARQAELYRVTLMSIGDAVITTDQRGGILQMNPIAERLTRWSAAEAAGRALNEVFRSVNEETREPAEDPVARALSEGAVVNQTNQVALTTLVARDGSQTPIDESAAPIRLNGVDIVGAILVFRDVSEKKQLQRQLAWQASHDVLTGLPNRILLSDRLGHAIARAARDKRLVAVGLIDLDEFKPVNDRLGHEVGDRLLQLATLRMQEVLRATDTLARLGGDEFVLILPNVVSQEEVELVFGRLLDQLALPYDVQGERLRVTASLGYTLYPIDQADGDSLLRHADAAMYAAKHAGRNRCVLFDPGRDPMRQAPDEQQTLLRTAIAGGEFELYYQPKIDMRRGQIIGLEALARWRHPLRGLLSPADFLPLTLGADLASELGRWTLRSVIAQADAWQTKGYCWPVAANIAREYFSSHSFIPDLDAALSAHPGLLGQHCLELEIVESATLEGLEQTAMVIAACKTRGIEVTLDNFGVGYGSLVYLKRLPVDNIKIDRSFVRDILDDAGDLAVAEAIITLAKLFGRQIAAEGVEFAEQGALLMRLGCDIAQGYGICRPLPADEIPGWVDTWQPDPNWGIWADTRWEISDFPLLLAQYDHLRWTKSVLEALQGGVLLLSPDELTDHHACRLGHWYDTHGKRRYGHLQTYDDLYPVHMAVHATGQEILRLKQAGRLAEAEAKARELLELKDQILEHLRRLQRDVATAVTRTAEPGGEASLDTDETPAPQRD